jgi:hypothetical protein
MSRCEIVEVRNSADAVGIACSRMASTQCSDCGIGCVTPIRKRMLCAAKYSARFACPSTQLNTPGFCQWITGQVASAKLLDAFAIDKEYTLSSSVRP